MRAAWSKGRKRSSCQREAGFTLIELLISLFVFAIAALAIAAMTFMSIRGNAFTNQTSQANFLAQDKMEELLSFPDYLILDTALGLAPDNVDGSGAPGASYARNWVATTCDGAAPPAPNLADPSADPTSCWLAVTVNWTDTKGDHQVVARSLWRSQ